MYQTLQSTGIHWILTLVKPGGLSIRLAYDRDFDTVVSNIIPSVTVRVLTDGIILQYVTLIRKLRS